MRVIDRRPCLLISALALLSFVGCSSGGGGGEPLPPPKASAGNLRIIIRVDTTSVFFPKMYDHGSLEVYLRGEVKGGEDFEFEPYIWASSNNLKNNNGFIEFSRTFKELPIGGFIATLKSRSREPEFTAVWNYGSEKANFKIFGLPVSWPIGVSENATSILRFDLMLEEAN